MDKWWMKAGAVAVPLLAFASVWVLFAIDLLVGAVLLAVTIVLNVVLSRQEHDINKDGITDRFQL
jgi:hypothetical protein